MTRHDTVDVLIIGAGPAGSAAGAWLARRGHKVACVERDVFPRFVIGESLLPRCNDLLAEAGLLTAVEARGYMVKPGATFWQGDKTRRFRFAGGLPGDRPSTFQVPRDDFDQTLATGARAAGVDLRFAQEVTAARQAEAGRPHEVQSRDLETGAETTWKARFLLDCSGYGRVLCRLWGLDRPAGMATRSALFTMVEGDDRPAGDEAGSIWVCISDAAGVPRDVPGGVWIWIIPFSNGRTSVGVVGPPEVIDVPGDPGSLLEPRRRARLLELCRGEVHAAERLRKAVPVLPTRRLHGWTTKVERTWGPGWALAGNAGDFLDPVFSSGVCVALESSLCAARLADRELAGGAVDWPAEFSAPIAAGVEVFRTFVETWYTGDLARIFFSPKSTENIQASITSVLAGYVLNKRNSLVRNPREGIARILELL